MTNLTYFFLGAISLAIGLIIKPYIDMVVMRIKRLFTAKKRTPNVDCALLQHNIEEIVEQINEMEQQINNLIEVKYNREKNRKSNIRREVREYLKELRDEK